MSCEVRDINNGEGLLYTYYGSENDSEYIDANPNLWKEIGMENIRFSIIDTREQTTITSTNDIKIRAIDCVKLSESLSSHIVAIVTSSDLSYGLARMWSSYASQSGWNIQVCKSMSDAYEWVKSEYLQLFNEPLTQFELGKLLFTNDTTPVVA